MFVCSKPAEIASSIQQCTENTENLVFLYKVYQRHKLGTLDVWVILGLYGCISVMDAGCLSYAQYKSPIQIAGERRSAGF
jgi:hypothetical protein